MGNSDGTIMPALGLLGGLFLLGLGLFKSSKARRIADWARAGAGPLKEGEARMFAGKARSAVTVNSPVTQTPCAFYLETVEEFTGGRSSNWVIVEEKPYGGFYLDDGSGRALVLPGAGCLDLLKPEITGASDGVPGDLYTRATRRREQFIAAGEDVTVMGTPVPLGNLMGELRRGVGFQLPPDLMNELLALEKEKGPAAILCFFGPGLRTVTDASYEAYLSSAKSSSSTYLQIGALITAVTLAMILYTLKSSVPAGY